MRLTRETMEVDSTEEGEEFNPMLREFREVLVDHFQCAFKHIFHNCGDLIFHKRLNIEVSDAVPESLKGIRYILK